MKTRMIKRYQAFDIQDKAQKVALTTTYCAKDVAIEINHPMYTVKVDTVMHVGSITPCPYH